jgi:hypothetical protein
MHAYRFRISLEDVDEFYRDIEIKANSTFEELHNIIKQAVELEGQELASFFICDGKWKRIKEITLVDMADEEDDPKAPLVMSKVKLAETIDDPHQKLIYLYDYINMYEFNLELCKIFPTDANVKYPRCVRKSGIIPKAGSIGPLPIPEDFDENEVYEVEETSVKDEDDTFGLYSVNDVEGEFTEGSPEAFEDDKL